MFLFTTNTNQITITIWFMTKLYKCKKAKSMLIVLFVDYLD